MSTTILFQTDDPHSVPLGPRQIRSPPDLITLGDVKRVVDPPLQDAIYFFKHEDGELGFVKKLILRDEDYVPSHNGKILCWVVPLRNTQNGRETSIDSEVDDSEFSLPRLDRKRQNSGQSNGRLGNWNSWKCPSTMKIRLEPRRLYEDRPDTKGNYLGLAILGDYDIPGILVCDTLKDTVIPPEDDRVEPGDIIIQVDNSNLKELCGVEGIHKLKNAVQTGHPVQLSVIKKRWMEDNTAASRSKSPTNISNSNQSARSYQMSNCTHDHGWSPKLGGSRYGSFSSLDYAFKVSPGPGDKNVTQRQKEVTPKNEGQQKQLSIRTPVSVIVSEMKRKGSGIDIKDRERLDMTIPNSFIGEDMVEWLQDNVAGLEERKEAREYSQRLLTHGVIRHEVNNAAFSDGSFYEFSYGY